MFKIALNILYVLHKTQEIRPAYISKHNKTRDMHANLLMITDGYGNWHYLAIKSIPALLRGVTSTHNGDLYCLNCFHSYRTREALKKHEKLCYNNDPCAVSMPNAKNKYISSTPDKNSLRVPLLIYADIECSLMKIDSCENTSINSYTERKPLHVPCGYSIVTCCSYDKTKNRQICYRGQDCMEHFTKTLANIFIKYMNFEQKPRDLLTGDEQIQYDNEKVCFLCEKEFCIDKKSKEYKNYCKVRDHCHFTGKYRGAARSVSNLKYNIPRFVPEVFHNGSTYDNHLIIKQLSKDFDGYFNCIGENTEKYISFSVTFINKESANSNKKKKSDAYSLRFIDSFRFMNRGLDDLVKNITETKENISIDMLKERFYNTYRLCGDNIEKFKLLLRKGVYPDEYMDSWEKCKLPVSLEKEYYYSELTDSNINDGDIEHIKNVCNTFNINKLGKYDNLYASSDTALLADVFQNFRDKCLAIDKLDHAYYLSAPALSWHSGLKMTGQTLELLTDKNMLLLFENGIGGGLCNATSKGAKANKYMKNYNSIKENVC